MSAEGLAILKDRGKLDPRKRVVVTGVSMFTGFGKTQRTIEGVWAANRSCARTLEPAEDYARFNLPTTIGGQLWEEVGEGETPEFFELSQFMPDRKSLYRARPRNTHVGIEVGGLALEDGGAWRATPGESGIWVARHRWDDDLPVNWRFRKGLMVPASEGGLDTRKMMVFAGTTDGGAMEIMNYKDLLERQGRITTDFSIFASNDAIVDTLAIGVSATFGGRSFRSNSSACSSSLTALMEAAMHIKYYADDPKGPTSALVVGAETVVYPTVVAAFCKNTALTARYNDDPEHASRPYDRDRSGFTITEAGGAILLESLASARERGARVYAEVISFADFQDENPHPTASNGTGLTEAIDVTLVRGGLKARHIDYVNDHATSTGPGDKMAVEILNKKLPGVPFSSTKGAHLHPVGAAGAIESGITVLSMQPDMFAPRCTNLENPEFDGNYVRDPRQVPSPDISLKLSGAFGGHWGAVTFGKVIA